MMHFWDRLFLFAVSPGSEPVATLADTDAGHASANSSEPTTAALVEQAVVEFQAGENREQSFRQLVDAAYPEIRNFLARRVVSPDEALELTQETFLKIYTGLDGFRREASFRTWAFRIAHVTYLKWLARRRSRPQETQTTDPQASSHNGEDRWVAHEESPLGGVLRKETRQRLAEAIDELPEQEGRCMVLRVYHDLKCQEIADLLGLREGTVKAHLHHARHKLRARLEGQVERIDF